MTRIAALLTATTVTTALAFGASLFMIGAAHAQKGAPTPKPKIDCSKPENQNKRACKNQLKELSDDDLFHAGYWLARKGEYSLALHYLNQADNVSDARIQTYIGYATRKLGNWDKAMGHYTAALTANPDYTVARAYMGEAFLQKGDKVAAIEQLAEIARRCGTGCDEYQELADALAKFEVKG